MAKCSGHKNPLQHGGTGQGQRLPAGLQNGYVHVDEKDFADWIVFAQRFGAYLQYYNRKNEASGNWQSFFAHDVSAVLGTVAIQPAEQYKIAVSDRLRRLQNASPTSNLNDLKKVLGDLFSALFSFAKAIDGVLQKLPLNMRLPEGKEPPLRLIIENLVQVRLKPALAQVIFYYKAAGKLNLVKESVPKDWLILNREVENASAVIAIGLEERWRPGGVSWKDYYDSINAGMVDTSIFGSAAEEYKKLAHLANHNLFKGLLDDFLSAFSKIVAEAENGLLQTLENWDTHPAHYTLFLSFLKLFRLSREHLNTLTQRHLDFYYKDVLRLQPKPAAPDHAHVILTLTRGASVQQLPTGSLFRGGKDSDGNEVFYALDKDVVFNKASVAHLMAWYKGRAADNVGSINHAQRFFAAPVVNSEDGLGKELKTELKEWHPFVLRDRPTGSITMPKAEVGFAVASHYLFLAEGERRVKIKLAGSTSTATAQITTLAVDCYLTTEKGWHKVTNAGWSTGILSASDSTQSAILSFVLEGDVPAITAYNPTVHGGRFGVQVPVVKVVLKNVNTQGYSYSDSLAALTITKLALEVLVGMNDSGTTANDKGLKSLLLSSDTGIIDPSKPFRPFGAIPRKGNALLVGSGELFSKKGAQFSLTFTWTNLPGDARLIDFDKKPNASATAQTSQPEFDVAPNYPSTSFSFLEKGNFGTGTSRDVFNGTAAKVTVPSSSFITVPDSGRVPAGTAVKPYDISSVSGFLKISLNGNFGHDDYQQALTTYLLEKAKGTLTEYKLQPVEPYTPTLQSLTVSYKASAVNHLASTAAADFDNRSIQFFHLYPFGEAEQHAAITQSGSINLLPQFNHLDEKAKTVQHQGEFYIGLKDLLPNQSINLLVQLLEGTTDPQVDKPDQHLHWSYLSQNQWQSFKNGDYDDATNGLIQSGILSFVVPDNASLDNTILPSGYIWLRAAIAEEPEAVSRLLSVTAQAAKLTLQLDGVAPDFLKTPLPAGTISKLKNPVTAVKKIEQPYASFGGRLEEEPGQFYVRASERLRHKSRAITIWDYERLVLEAFPQIHKVKCLNHTRIEDNLYNEVAPGYVSIVTIPKTVHRNDVNPLKPYTSQDLLTEIENFLQKKTSCHVIVQARQPLFEEVKLKFSLRLMEGYEFNYYSTLLKEEITRFLSPWAYEGRKEIDFGGKVHKSVLINFIEEHPYVDYISQVQLLRRESGLDKDSKDMVEASTARSVLVSVPASVHEIIQITTSSSNTINEICNECGKA